MITALSTSAFKTLNAITIRIRYIARQLKTYSNKLFDSMVNDWVLFLNPPLYPLSSEHLALFCCDCTSLSDGQSAGLKKINELDVEGKFNFFSIRSLKEQFSSHIKGKL